MMKPQLRETFFDAAERATPMLGFGLCNLEAHAHGDDIDAT